MRSTHRVLNPPDYGNPTGRVHPFNKTSFSWARFLLLRVAIAQGLKSALLTESCGDTSAHVTGWRVFEEEPAAVERRRGEVGGVSAGRAARATVCWNWKNQHCFWPILYGRRRRRRSHTWGEREEVSYLRVGGRRLTHAQNIADGIQVNWLSLSLTEKKNWANQQLSSTRRKYMQ